MAFYGYSVVAFDVLTAYRAMVAAAVSNPYGPAPETELDAFLTAMNGFLIEAGGQELIDPPLKHRQPGFGPGEPYALANWDAFVILWESELYSLDYWYQSALWLGLIGSLPVGVPVAP